MIKSDAWKAEWRARIGGGRSAAAAGIHEYVTAYELYRSMVEGAEPDLCNPNMLRGIMLEPVAMQRLQMLYPDMAFEAHDQDRFIYNDAYPWASDLPDFWVSWNGQRIPVQCKVPTPDNWHRLDSAIPDYIRANCVHSVAMNESGSILLACLNPVTMDMILRVITPSHAEIDALMSAEQRFFADHIVPRIPPPLKTSSDIKLRWPTHLAGVAKIATIELERDHADLVRAKAAAKELDGQISELSDRIKIAMEDAELLLPAVGGAKPLATWRTHTARVFDLDGLKADRPDLARIYTRERTSRVFLVKTL